MDIRIDARYKRALPICMGSTLAIRDHTEDTWQPLKYPSRRWEGGKRYPPEVNLAKTNLAFSLTRAAVVDPGIGMMVGIPGRLESALVQVMASWAKVQFFPGGHFLGLADQLHVGLEFPSGSAGG